MDALAYSASVGFTTDLDMGAHMHDAGLARHWQKKMAARLRVFFLSMDTQPTIPLLSERLHNPLDGVGGDMLRISGIGEFATVWPLFGKVTPPPNYEAALRAVAKAGWPFQQHSLSLAEDQLTAGASIPRR